MYCEIIISIMENKPIFRPDPDAKLMDQVREVLRYYHYAYRTESHYCRWILYYIQFFGGKTHPRKLDAKHIEKGGYPFRWPKRQIVGWVKASVRN